MFNELTQEQNDTLRAMMLAAVLKYSKLCHYVVSDAQLWAPAFGVMQDCNDAVQELAAAR